MEMWIVLMTIRMRETAQNRDWYLFLHLNQWDVGRTLKLSVQMARPEFARFSDVMGLKIVPNFQWNLSRKRLGTKKDAFSIPM
jgi:hypothetical protein